MKKIPVNKCIVTSRNTIEKSFTRKTFLSQRKSTLYKKKLKRKIVGKVPGKFKLGIKIVSASVE